MKIDRYTIKEIKSHLKENKVTEDIIKKLLDDSRKGVNRLGRKYLKLKKQQQKKMEEWQQKNKKQIKLQKAGYKKIAGIDEAGRGPLAGPVVAAAVILNCEEKIIGLNDSKKLKASVREKLFDQIREKAVAVGTGIIDNEVIDQINIFNAAYLAMKIAVENLNVHPDYLLVDGNQTISSLNIEQGAVIAGDSKINAIAAASIIAKVTRDSMLEKFHEQYPEYGFKKNKGYCTKKHIAALKKYGPTPLHRHSFNIVKNCDENGYIKQSLF